jgi:transposase-like protein
MEHVALKYCPLCSSENLKSVNNINAVWRALPIYKCESCSLRFSIRRHDTDINIDLE